ncbi:MAG: O-methyltransferase [Cyclobacteriaceae bacterium]|nr:O-methyltransferase [Cyclobacteriaceae bacterium]
MEIIDRQIERYIEQFTTDPGQLLQTIDRETQIRSVYPRMLSGKVQGRFLAMISRMLRPKSVLEIGTFTGYSALCLAEGLAEDGHIDTIEINEELAETNRMNFANAGLSDKITPHIGDALDIIPTFGKMFDLIFIDADKINYPVYFDLGLNVLKVGGFMIADNVLWSGKVLDIQNKNPDKDAEAVKVFNNLVHNDARVENVMIPLRDGMTIIQKIC